MMRNQDVWKQVETSHIPFQTQPSRAHGYMPLGRIPLGRVPLSRIL